MPGLPATCRVMGATVSLLLAVLLPSVAAASDPRPYPGAAGGMADAYTDTGWYRQCMALKHLRPATGVSVPKAATCDATALYYDKLNQAQTTAAEWEQVRRCAATTDDDGVLMMLYANGRGVARNDEMAKMHACQLEAAPAETEARLEHLERGGRPFDLCDDITSGVMGGVCATIRAHQADKARQARLDRYQQSLSGKAVAAFKALRKAAASFATAHAENETDMTGTGAQGFLINAANRQEEQFLQDVLSLNKGTLPKFTSRQFAAADARLNRVYGSVLEQAPAGNLDARIGHSTVTWANVRQTERSWLAYRDAWTRFVAARGQHDPVSINTLLTQRRIEQLEKLAKWLPPA